MFVGVAGGVTEPDAAGLCIAEPVTSVASPDTGDAMAEVSADAAAEFGPGPVCVLETTGSARAAVGRSGAAQPAITAQQAAAKAVATAEPRLCTGLLKWGSGGVVMINAQPIGLFGS